jgi:hypothetical protein
MGDQGLLSSGMVNAVCEYSISVFLTSLRLQACLSLVCPTERVQTMAAVEGQTDALIGSTHGGHVVLW